MQLQYFPRPRGGVVGLLNWSVSKLKHSALSVLLNSFNRYIPVLLLIEVAD